MRANKGLITDIGLTPKKNRGQVFLVDDNVARRHVEYASIQRHDRVLEIGPGLGILTRHLIHLSDSVTCIEIDSILVSYLNNIFHDNVQLIHDDALNIDFPPFDILVSNLPYNISTPIIFKLLKYKFRTAVIMVQKEFADRMVANVGSSNYSRLTVNLSYYVDCKIMEIVPASKFTPHPKVDSAIVRMVPHDVPFNVVDEKTFFKVVDVTFSNRRKKIGTSLRNAGIIRSMDDIPHLENRVENLSPADINDIANAIFELNVKRCK